MKCLSFALLITTACVFAQAPTATPASSELTMDTVVVRVGAKPYTAADIKALAEKLPADAQKAFLENPKSALQSLAMLEYLSTEGEKAKLAEISPYKEQLQMQRQQMLAQAMVGYHASTVDVPEADVRKKYDADPKQYEQAKIRIILIGFLDPNSPAPKSDVKLLSEAEAKAKAEDLVKQARAGADFAELAKKNSQDRSAANGGAFGTIRRADKAPDEIKNVVFAQKAGGVTDPVKQGPGFYIIKVEEYITPKYEEVHDGLMLSMKSELHQQWIQALQKRFAVTIEKPEFFTPPKPATPPAPAPAPAK